MYGTIHVYGINYVTVHNTVHINGSMTWHWPMMWHWLMRCHDPVGLKFLCTVDGDVAAYQWMKNLAYGTCITQDYFQLNRVTVHPSQTALLFIRVKPCYCSSAWSNRGLLTDDVAQSRASKLFLIRWPWFTPCIYKKGASPPNLISLNPFLGSIFCNSFSILYFLCILINSHFAPSSIMSS